MFDDNNSVQIPEVEDLKRELRDTLAKIEARLNQLEEGLRCTSLAAQDAASAIVALSAKKSDIDLDYPR